MHDDRGERRVPRRTCSAARPPRSSSRQAARCAVRTSTTSTVAPSSRGLERSTSPGGAARRISLLDLARRSRLRRSARASASGIDLRGLTLDRMTDLEVLGGRGGEREARRCRGRGRREPTSSGGGSQAYERAHGRAAQASAPRAPSAPAASLEAEPSTPTTMVPATAEAYWRFDPGPNGDRDPVREPSRGARAEGLALAEQARQPPVLEHAAAGLALRAVVDRVLLEVDARDRRAADVAGLAELVVDAVRRSRRSRRARAARARARAPRRSRRRAARPRPSSSWVESANGESRAWWRISFAHARPMPGDHALVAEQRVQPARLAARGSRASRSAPRPSASGPRCASSASAASGVSSQTPARFFEPASVSTSCGAALEREPEGRRLRPLLAGAQVASAGRRSSGGRAATSSPSSVGKSSRLARRSAPARRRPSSAASGGSNVFSVAMCAGPGLRDRERATPARRAGVATPPSRVARALGLPPHGRPDQRTRAPRRRPSSRAHLVHAVAVRDGGRRRRARRRGRSSPSCARRRSRSRRCRSRARATISTTATSRSRRRRTSRAPSSSRRCARCSPRRPRARTSSSAGSRASRRRALQHNCSGKHAGMLALCRAHGWPSEGYRLAGHPVQRGVARRGRRGGRRARPDELPTAVDGCGVVTFALPLERMALRVLPARAARRRARAVAAAMRAHPELIRGPGAPDTVLMRALPGWVAKGGAEGLRVRRRARTGSGSRSRSRTAPVARSAPRSRPSSPSSATRSSSSPSHGSRTRAARPSARSSRALSSPRSGGCRRNCNGGVTNE